MYSDNKNEVLSFQNLLLKYHEHKEAGTPTVDKTQHGGKETWESLETMLKEFDKTVLNKNIRIN